MPGSFAALIARGVWNLDSPNFALTEFSEVLARRSFAGLARGCILLRRMASSGRRSVLRKESYP